jgi:2,3-bisphosphoglycerate-independent phosphoglycerate mutase
MSNPANRPLVLIIRDGWGLNPNPEHDSFNAPLIASQRGLTPVADRIARDYPWTLIKTCGEDVGLPEGTMGNSEVGHQNIGAGRIVDQESVAITKACRAGLDKNPVIAAAIRHAIDHNKNVHLLGIASDAGVHGQLDHLDACLRACKALGLPANRVFLHLFTDGRDTGPFTGIEFIKRVERAIKDIGVGRIATIAGRYYAMDRDYRWERVALAYAAMTGRTDATPAGQPKPRTAATAQAAIQSYYDAPTNDSQKGDEFVIPTIIGATPQDQCDSRISSGDTVIFYNYRGDRPREISAAFVFPDEQWAKIKPSPDSGRSGFPRGPIMNLHYVTMTAYWEELAPLVHVAFPKPPKMKNIAGEYLSTLRKTQFRCAETEKYPHVTFFFNDYRDEPFPGERRENPQSPKVATYDLKPEMSADQVRDAVLRRLAAPDCEDLIVVNFANGDMVGHTGNLEAAIKACAVVDQCVGKIIDATLARGSASPAPSASALASLAPGGGGARAAGGGGALIITADHGNCEQMFDPITNAPHTAHTVYDVPLYIVSAAAKDHTLRGDTNPRNWFNPVARASRGRLADVMPTALELMGIPKPSEMEGQSLLL